MGTVQPQKEHQESTTNLTSQNWMERGQRVLIPTYARQPLVLVRGQGVRVWDVEGREYLDFIAGISVCNLGHVHPQVSAALNRQVQELVHVSNLYHIPNQIELAERLTDLSFAERAFFCNSGAEANEGAIKLCRRYAYERFGPERYQLICMHNSFHGRTLATLSATGQEKFWQGFAPLLPGFAFVPFNDLEAVAQAINPSTAAILVEPIQGEGGVQMPAPGYLEGLRQLCDRHELLLVFDEVQTGMGRTGKLFAYEHFGIAPDIMTLAKALANGLPIGCLLATDQVAQVFGPGSHASTFGGGPVVTAAAGTVIDIISQPTFLAEVREKGEYFKTRLQQLQARHDLIKQVRGLGLMLAMELDRDGGPIVLACRERGALINCTQGNILRFLPPLLVTRDEIDQFLTILAEALKAV
ncbi:MAG: aspartate aminotransferase family protein [Desulfobacca sp. 4484_104]|nr:MAG: aspartate aminotransferase family protein [Desulfobacca sp. 4484_104]